MKLMRFEPAFSACNAEKQLNLQSWKILPCNAGKPIQPAMLKYNPTCNAKNPIYHFLIVARLQYPVVPRNEGSRPTAVMLSHVYGAKDIVTAIKAAKVIISQYGVSGEACCHSGKSRKTKPVLHIPSLP